MDLISKKAELSGHITVPGSKSHTIRALILASLAEGESVIRNPLASNDCISAAKAISALGAEVSGVPSSSEWHVKSSRALLNLPLNPEQNPIDVGNSGSTMYFLSPVCASLAKDDERATVVFTGDSSICKRPVGHLLDALNQLGCKTSGTENSNGMICPPFTISGKLNAGKVKTVGELSQYISGLMMACSQIEGTTRIELTNPKEVPYLDMTKWWLEKVGVNVDLSSDYHSVVVKGKQIIRAFDRTIPSDWEGVAFPIIAALISKSCIYIDGIDTSGTQGDEKIVPILQSLGAKISYVDSDPNMLFVDGKNSTLSTSSLADGELFADGELHVALADFPDAICALAVIACFVEGTTVLEDIDICRKKETDRIIVMEKELSALGANIKDCGDKLVIHGKKDGLNLHGGTAESYEDHRVAMSLACLGLGLKENESLTVKNAECCSVSFPDFVQKMNKINAGFIIK